MNHQKIFAGLCIAVAVTHASAVDQSALTSFQPNTTASASEVNANFEVLRQAVNTITAANGNLLPNWTFEDGSNGWAADATKSPGANFQIIAAPGAPAGEAALRNAANTVLWGSSTQWVHIDRNLTYRITGTFQRISNGGDGNIFLAVRLRDASGAEIAGVAAGDWWYYPVNNVSPGSLNQWTHYHVEIGAGTAKPFPANARYATVGFALNYFNSTAAGRSVYDVQGLGMYVAGKSTAWTNLTLASRNSPYGGNYQSPQYRLRDDEVCLRGLLNLGNSTIATLPAGYRPPAQLIFSTGPETGAPSRIDIESNGNITAVVNNGTGWAALDGICFSTTP